MNRSLEAKVDRLVAELEAAPTQCRHDRGTYVREVIVPCWQAGCDPLRNQHNGCGARRIKTCSTCGVSLYE